VVNQNRQSGNNLQATEKTCQMVQAVWAALTEMYQLGGLSIVIGLDQHGGHSSYTCKSNLEQACIDKAGQCFTQAHDAPLLLQPLVNIFGEMGNNSQALNKF